MYIAFKKGGIWGLGAKTKIETAYFQILIWKIHMLDKIRGLSKTHLKGVLNAVFVGILAIYIGSFSQKTEKIDTKIEIPKITQTYPVAFAKVEKTFEIVESRDKIAQAQTIATANAEKEKAQKRAEVALSRVSSNRVENTNSASMSLEELRNLYKSVASKYGVEWKLIEAVHQVETGKSTAGAKVSSAGARGPMQFMPSTFRKYADSPDANIYNVIDSVNAAAKLLAANGAASGNEYSALLAYNHADWYVKKVEAVKNSIVE